MKTFKLLSLLIFSTLLLSCSNDDEIYFDEFLLYTTWEGTAVMTVNGSEVRDYDIVMQFLSEDSGLLIESYYGSSIQGVTSKYNFEYSIEGKLLKLNSSNSIAYSGYYTIVSASKKRMVLEAYTGSGYNNYKVVMTLDRKH